MQKFVFYPVYENYDTPYLSRKNSNLPAERNPSVIYYSRICIRQHSLFKIVTILFRRSLIYKLLVSGSNVILVVVG